MHVLSSCMCIPWCVCHDECARLTPNRSWAKETLYIINNDIRRPHWRECQCRFFSLRQPTRARASYSNALMNDVLVGPPKIDKSAHMRGAVVDMICKRTLRLCTCHTIYGWRRAYTLNPNPSSSCRVVCLCVRLGAPPFCTLSL